MAGLAFPPDTLFAGRYRPVSLIANGGMGQVLEAVDERLRRPVAVKLVNTASDEEALRLRAEGLSLARLHHPNIVGIYDTGDHDGRTFIVTELVRGESLLARMQREGPLPLDTVAALGTDLARALECAHHHGVVHRDLKPANILIDDEGRARLIDFGIATSAHAASITQTGMVIGTPAYLSPEQVEGERATPSSDMYALGLVLFEAATGRPAFPGTVAETTAARLARNPEPPDELGPRWRWLLSALTRRDPLHRPAATSMASLLSAMTEDDDVEVSPPVARAAPKGIRGRWRRRNTALAVAVVSAVGATSPGGDEPEPGDLVPAEATGAALPSPS